MASAVFAAGAALALDNTVNNDFWDTRGYVNPSPASSPSSPLPFSSFTVNDKPSTTLHSKFRSAPSSALVLCLR